MTVWCSMASWWVHGGGREAVALLAGMVALLFVIPERNLDGS